MLVTHKIFLYWLLYAVLVVFSMSIATVFGLPQLIVSNDHSYLSVLLMLLYVAAEAMAAREVFWLSSIHRQVMETSAWLSSNRLIEIRTNGDLSVDLIARDGDRHIPDGPFSGLIRSMKDKASNSGRGMIEQDGLMDAFVEQMERRTNIASFLASRIVWIGILATIVGVIMAFWPFQQSGMTIDAMRGNLSLFFSGVAVAFIPTAVSFVFKIFLDFNTKIMDDGISEVIEVANRMGASFIIPHLEKR